MDDAAADADNVCDGGRSVRGVAQLWVLLLSSSSTPTASSAGRWCRVFAVSASSAVTAAAAPVVSVSDSSTSLLLLGTDVGMRRSSACASRVTILHVTMVGWVRVVEWVAEWFYCLRRFWFAVTASSSIVFVCVFTDKCSQTIAFKLVGVFGVGNRICTG